MKITYKFVTGETTEVEVSDEIGTVVIDLDRKEYNSNHKETRRHCSLEAYNLDDNLLPSDFDVEEDYIVNEEIKHLYAAIGKLDSRQRYLIEQVYFKERRISEIARAEGKNESSVRETLNRAYWLLEVSELNGIKKMDVETVKSFISRTDDKYRQSYGINVENHPRSCVIVGTTNSDGGFLRDITGNRRFWPVSVTGHGKYHPWDLTEVDQVWAEAIEYFNQGEELFLKGDVAAEAFNKQREAMETDAREGIVQDYLDMLLPEDWDSYDLYQRRNFISGSEFGGETHEGTVKRTRVCAMEIWCECFGKNREAMKKADSYEIEGILYKLGNWTKYTGSASGKCRVPGYGVQKAYMRVPDGKHGKHD